MRVCFKLMEEAVRSGDLQRVQELIRSGVDVNPRLSARSGSLLMTAIINSYKDIALALLAAGADVHAKDARGWTALHWACMMRLEKVVQALIDRGSRVDEPDTNGSTPLEFGSGNAAMCLLRAGASCKELTNEKISGLFRHACSAGDVLAVQSLLEKGSNVNTLSIQEQTELLHCACDVGNVLVVEALIADGCSVNTVNPIGRTPLMLAAREGHEEIVKKLILAGANLAEQDDIGYTALHYAANRNHILCGILLAEEGASVRTKNKYSETPLDVATKADFQRAIKQALSFTTRKTLCIIGNAEGGKSSLIASLQAESTGLLGRNINRFRRVDDRRKRTAGIETVPHCSQKYGEVLFFDFAGQDDYHGPHQMFLESLLSKPGVSMTLLLVVKMTEGEEAILHQLHRWLSPVALMASTASPPQIIILGSFLDRVKSKEEATAKLTRCIEATRKDLEDLPLEFVGTCFLNCRQPQSEGIDQLCTFLQEVPVPEFRATHTCYSLAWVLSQIRSSIKAQAVQLQDFSAWIKGNEDNLPRTMLPPEEVCRDLSAAGHALYLPNKEDPPKSWLVLDLPSILHDVYGTLFSQSKETVNEFGLLHCHHLGRLFSDLDLAMVQQLLISLEFCIPVDPSILKVDLSELTQSEESSGWLFFPALISPRPSEVTSEGLHEQSVHCLCWQLRTSRKHSISARILQTILLRLAAHFVVKQRDEEGVQQHCCSIWWNGIAWQSTIGVNVTLHIKNNRVIQVIAAGTMADELCQYLTDVVSDILSTICRLSPKLAAAAYIVHPPKVATSPKDTTGPLPKELFPVDGMWDSIREHKLFALSLKDSNKHSKMASLTDLFGGCTPSLANIERIVWPQPVANQSGSATVPNQLELCIEGYVTLTDSQMVPSGAQALLDISSTPDIKDIDKLVVGEVAAHWQRLALRLGVKGCLSEIVLKNHPNDCEGACRDLLDRWLRGERHTGEEERTWSTLLAGLGRAGFVELEKSLWREQFKKK